MRFLNKRYLILIPVLFLLSCNTNKEFVANYKNISTDESLNFFYDINKIMPIDTYKYREFRAAWIATISAIDFPIIGGRESEQKELIITHLETLKQNNFNAVFLQVKPDAGVIYPSKINPTTRYFFSKEAKDEKAVYPFATDLLKYFIEEAHKRNIEVHAWINPFRMSLSYDKKKSLKKQFIKKNFIHKYNKAGLKPIYWADNRLYIDPGEPISKKYVIDTIVELVENYDIDGIHLDDYFYQYPINGKTFKDWPDEAVSKKYATISGFNRNDTSLDDYGKKGLYAWRRYNINTLVNNIYIAIKSRKPYVKFTISPIGVWRNKEPFVGMNGDINGTDTKTHSPNFDALHADVLMWLLNGEKTSSISNAIESDGLGKMYVDAIIPQLYWDISPSVSYYSVLDWWGNQVEKGYKTYNNNVADLYIGHSIYKVGTKTSREDWIRLDIISKQIKYLRSNKYIKGSAFFTMHNFYTNDTDTKGLGSVVLSNLLKDEYKYQAIAPIMNTIKLRDLPPSPESFQSSISNNTITLSWLDYSGFNLDQYLSVREATAVSYVIYRQKSIGANKMELEIIARIRRDFEKKEYTYTFTDMYYDSRANYTFYITSLDRLNNESSYMKSSLSDEDVEPLI